MAQKPFLNTLITRNVSAFAGPQGSIYEATVLIAKRAKQISLKLKEELDNKLEELTVDDGAIMDEHQQSKHVQFYEEMPKPTITATEEYLSGKLMYRYIEPEDTA